MSRSAKEVVDSIRENPEDWRPYDRSGKGLISSDGAVMINGCGNGIAILFYYATSIADLYVDDRMLRTSYVDRVRMEKIVKWWWENAPLSAFKQGE